MKFLAVFSLFASLLLAGCGGGAANNANVNANMNVNKGTPTPVANMSSGTDSTVQTAIETNLKGKGCTGATVSVSGGVATVRGTYPKGKLSDCMMAVNDAKPGKVENQMTEAK